MPRPTSSAAPRGIAGLLAALATLGPFSIDTYLPSFGDIGASLGATELQVQAQKEGMDTMYEDGLRKAVAGQTTIEEVLRVTTQQEQEA